jgi:hypothetical protein
MAWLFVPEERVRAMSLHEAYEALAVVITARRRLHGVAVASGPVLAVGSVAVIGMSWWLAPALVGVVLASGVFSNWSWHLYRSACVLGTVGYARDALVGRMVATDNLGFGPNR